MIDRKFALFFGLTLFLAAPMAQPDVSLANNPNPNSTTAPAVVDSQTMSSVDYLPLSPRVRPFDGLSVDRGLFQPNRPYIFAPDTGLQTIQSVNWQTREVRIQQNYVSPRTGVPQELWQYTYPEIADYAFDLSEFTLRNLWLKGLVGQDGGGYRPLQSNTPLDLPGVLGDLSMARPSLVLTGDMTMGLKGTRTISSNDPYSSNTSLFAVPAPFIDANFKIDGKIGPHLTLEMNTTQDFGHNDVKLIYKEATPNEFEDNILQEFDAGRINLELPGTELTGYSENHTGLFGVKTKLKFGDVMLTAIASQESGNQSNFTINPKSKETEFNIRDKDFIPYKYYFLSDTDRAQYVKDQLSLNTSNNRYQTIYVYSLANVGDTGANIISNVTLRYPGKVRPDQTGRRVKQLIAYNPGSATNNWDYWYNKNVIYFPRGNSSTLYAYSPTEAAQSGSVLMILKDNDESVPELNRLMLRNHYSVGISDANKAQFALTLEDNLFQPLGASKLAILGIADKTTGIPSRNDPTIFNTATGEMILPCQILTPLTATRALTPSKDTVIIPAGMNFIPFQDSVCLEPFRVLSDTLSAIYQSTVRDLNQAPTRYGFKGKSSRRSTTIKVSDNQSVSSGGCFDISPGTEKVMIGSTQLVRGVDYNVMYEYGQIDLLSDRAKDPNNEINVSYECEPTFSIDNRMLMGLRAEYPFWKLGKGSLLGVTALYKSLSTTALVPQVGQEPYQQLLFGANVKLTDQSRDMTKMVNILPFVKVNQPSQWRFEAEVAHSYVDPNTRGAAELDDFENSDRVVPYLLKRQAWTQASPPGGTSLDGGLFNPDLDYRHMGLLIWSSNFTRYFSDIYGSTGDSRTDATEVPIMQLDFTSNDDLLNGKSWGGVMKANSDYSKDLSQYRYIDLVVQGDIGVLNLDFGAISEDLSINGFAPDGVLESEGDPRTGKAMNDYGLDGQPNGPGEKRLEWHCRDESCTSTLIAYPQEKDASGDDFVAQPNATRPTAQINGTEGNNADKGGWDSEDLNRNGSLDLANDFVRYKVDLSQTMGYIPLNGGWRRYQIPLSQFDTIYSDGKLDLGTILRNNAFTRIWVGHLPDGVSQTEIQLAKLAVVGSQWVDGGRSTAYDSLRTNDNQIASTTSGSNNINLSQTGTLDSNVLNVRVINNRDNIGTYYQSPNTVNQPQSGSDSPSKEQSLVLQYSNLHKGQVVTATRTFDSDAKDLTNYSDMDMEIHLDGIGSGVRENVRFAIQIGNGDATGSNNYYEWSFRPHAGRCDAVQAADTGKTLNQLKSDLQACNNTDWLSNQFSIPLKDLWPLLKFGAHSSQMDSLWKLKSDTSQIYNVPFNSQNDLWNALQVIRNKTSYSNPEDSLIDASSVQRANILAKLSRLEAIGVVGNPTLSKVNWIRFVIRVDEDATTPATGTLWIDDMRLTGVRSGWGSAARSTVQFDLSDFATLSANLAYRDGDFATLASSSGSPLPSLAQAQTTLQGRADAKVSLDKFLKDSWKTKIPLTLSTSSELDRPYMQPGSDLNLTHDDLGTIASDFFSNGVVNDSATEAKYRKDTTNGVVASRGFQSLTEISSFGVGYKRDAATDGSFLLSSLRSFLLERPVFNFRFDEKNVRSSQSIDTSRIYNTVIQYDLSRKSAPMALTFRPWPEQFDLTLFDFTYNRTWHRDRSLDLLTDTLAPIKQWQVTLNHKANLQWSFFSFASMNYTLNIARSMDDQWQAWGSNGIMGNSAGGFLGRNEIFDWDHSDYTYVISPGDSVTPRHVVSFNQTNLGSEYGILNGERQRNQNFRLSLTPKIPFLTFINQRVNYSADFNQTKTIPDDFDPNQISEILQNYWTVNRTVSFEYRPTIQLNTLSGYLGQNNAVQRTLSKLQWNNISLGWVTSVKTQGENFTLPFLRDSAMVSPANYYLWGLGLGDGSHLRNGWDIITGDEMLHGPRDHTLWAQYFSPYFDRLDSLVDQKQFSNVVDRTASAETRLVLPFAWDVSLNGNLAWKLDFQQNRVNPLQIDTTISWPKYSIGARLPNIVPRLSFLKEYLTTLTFNTRFNFERQFIDNAFQATQDAVDRKWSFDPLFGFQTETKQHINISNDVSFSIDRGWQYLNKYSPEADTANPAVSKLGTIATPGVYDMNQIYGDSVTLWAWRDENFVRTVHFGDKATISYAIPTNKGFRFARWYIRLKNPINLSLGFTADWTKAYLYNYKGGTDSLDNSRTYLIYGNPSNIYHPYVVQLDMSSNPSTVTQDLLSLGGRIGADYRISEKITSDGSIEYRHDANSVGGGTSGPIVTSTLTYILRIKVTF